MNIGPHAVLTAEGAHRDIAAGTDSQPPITCVGTQAQLTSEGTRKAMT